MQCDHSVVFLAVLMMAAVLPSTSDAQIQTQKIEPAGLTPAAMFGSGIDVDGRRAVVAGGGGAYLYEQEGDEWTLLEKFGVTDDPPPESTFGSGVAIDDGWITVGGGPVRLYRSTQGVWTLAQTISVGYATSVALDGTSLVVGVPDGAGRVYTFELRGGTWVRSQVIDGPLGEGLFGLSVALQDPWLVVGAPMAYWVFPWNFGYAYIYRRTLSSAGTVEWKLETTLGGGIGEAFGEAVAIDRNTIMVGAPGQWDTGGVTLNKVHVFELGPSGWSKTQVFGIPDSLYPDWAHDNFGGAISLSGDQAIIGADLYFSEPVGIGYYLNGAAYHYRRVSGDWTCLGRLRTSDQGLHDYTGTAVAICGDHALVGVPGRDRACPDHFIQCNSGAVYSFHLAPDVAQYCSCIAPPCGNSQPHGGCENSTGFGAVLAAAGSTSVAIDALQFEIRWLPPEIRGFVLMGPTPANGLLGDGGLCVGAGSKGLYRFAPANSGPEGVITLGPGIVAYSHANFPMSGHIQPGDTWYFQAWYRDPIGPCGSGFNLSNGLKVEFTQ